LRKAKETWIEKQWQDIEEKPRRTTEKKAYQLVKDFTSTNRGR